MLGDATKAALEASEDTLVYLDPPYTSRPYGSNFFPLNVIADVDHDPEVKGVTGIPVSGWNRSRWNNPAGALSELTKILNGTKAKRLVLSYSTDGLMKTDDIIKAFNENGWAVKLKKIEQKRFKSHDEGIQDESELTELLFLGRKSQ